MEEGRDKAGGLLPSAIKAELRRLFGPDAEIINLGAARAKQAREDPEVIPAKPMTVEQARWLCERARNPWYPFVGDIVRIVAHPFNLSHMIWPQPDELCVVTGTPTSEEEWEHRGESKDSPLVRNDMILGWLHNCGDDDCHMEGALIEFWHDSRFFEKVGTIWDDDAKLERPKVPGM